MPIKKFLAYRFFLLLLIAVSSTANAWIANMTAEVFAQNVKPYMGRYKLTKGTTRGNLIGDGPVCFDIVKVELRYPQYYSGRVATTPSEFSIRSAYSPSGFDMESSYLYAKLEDPRELRSLRAGKSREGTFKIKRGGDFAEFWGTQMNTTSSGFFGGRRWCNYKKI